MTATEPAWITVLREACEAPNSSQSSVSKRLGYSAAVVCAVLKGSYKGDINRVKAAVEGALMGMTVECPVVGELPRDRCLEYQRRDFASTNHLRVQLNKACKTCPNRVGGAG